MASANAASRLDSWLDGTVPEGQRLDFKETVHLDSKPQKLELLKDLTAMGNGGGGTVVVGVAERKVDDLSVADVVVPLDDRSLTSRMADLILDSVRPTLTWKETYIDVEGGYVLILDVDPSPIGPYMVQFAGEYRYYRRVGEKSRPMPEDMVRDLYAAAAVWDRDRGELWANMQIPMAAHWGDHPLLTVTGVPIHVGDRVFDPAVVTIEDLRPAAAMHYSGYHAMLGGVPALVNGFRVWADGFYSEADGLLDNREKLPPEPQVRARVHRNGTCALAAHVATTDRLDPVRLADAYLAYFAALWATRGVRSVEFALELTGFERRPGTVQPTYPTADHPAGAPPISASVREVLNVDHLASPTSRHETLAVFANRVANSFGDPAVATGWTRGLLRTEQKATRLVATRGDIVDLNAGASPWLIAENGSVRHPSNLERRVAWWSDGALLDLDGNLLATIEFPTIENLQPDFAVGHPDATYGDDLQHRAPEALTATDGALGPATRPACTGRWAATDPVQYMRAQRDGDLG